MLSGKASSEFYTSKKRYQEKLNESETLRWVPAYGKHCGNPRVWQKHSGSLLPGTNKSTVWGFPNLQDHQNYLGSFRKEILGPHTYSWSIHRPRRKLYYLDFLVSKSLVICILWPRPGGLQHRMFFLDHLLGPWGQKSGWAPTGI